MQILKLIKKLLYRLTLSSRGTNVLLARLLRVCRMMLFDPFATFTPGTPPPPKLNNPFELLTKQLLLLVMPLLTILNADNELHP